MPLDLTNLDRTVLRRSPLASVICQVRYDTTPRASDAQTARAFYERLSEGDRFNQLDQVVESALNFSVVAGTSPAVAQQSGNTGWRLTAPDGTRIVSLMPTNVTVEATSYDGWEADFAPLLGDVLDAVSELVEPVFEQRIGLRYVNQMTEPEVQRGQDWHGWIEDSLLGLARHDELGPMVTFVREQAILQLDDETRATINSGFAPDPDRENNLTFLLDFDVAREGTRSFDLTSIRETADRFNSYALRLFQLATTAALRERLGDA